MEYNIRNMAALIQLVLQLSCFWWSSRKWNPTFQKTQPYISNWNTQTDAVPLSNVRKPWRCRLRVEKQTSACESGDRVWGWAVCVCVFVYTEYLECVCTFCVYHVRLWDACVSSNIHLTQHYHVNSHLLLDTSEQNRGSCLRSDLNSA